MTPQELLLRAAEAAERAGADAADAAARAGCAEVVEVAETVEGAAPAVADAGVAAEAVAHAGGTAPVATSIKRRLQPQFALLLAGVGCWAYGVAQLRPTNIGTYGLLATGNAWFVVGLLLLLAGLLIELRRSDPRTWLLGPQLVALIFAIHGTVPMVFSAPEYAWVYKHIGIASAFQQYGHVTDPSNIYQQWPALFAGVAAIGSLAHLNAISFAAWAPLAFELLDALLLLALFRQLTGDRRVSWLAVVLYEGLISWVGQDYLSPQAFGYFLWLAMMLVIVRWLRAPAATEEPSGRLARLRAPLLAGLRPAPDTTRGMRAVAVALVATIYFAIVAAHQLTPYVALAGIGALAVLDLVRPRWLLLLLGAIAGGYLIPHYGLIANQFGGLFSGGNPIANASGAHGTFRAGAEATTALIVRALAGCMWLLALAAVAARRRTPGRAAFAAALAFSPFAILAAQSYGGEAIYRVYLFSAPWCALLIAGGLCELPSLGRVSVRWLLIAAVCTAALLAGLQGLYGPVTVNAFTSQEVAGSRWLYAHIPRGSLIVLPQDNFPVLETADYGDYDVQVMPADPQLGESWMNEGNLDQVASWITDLGAPTAYIVVSRSMSENAAYFGAPIGYAQLVRIIPTALRGVSIYTNTDVTIYRLTVEGSPSTAPGPATSHRPPACDSVCRPGRTRSLQATPSLSLGAPGAGAGGSPGPPFTAPFAPIAIPRATG